MARIFTCGFELQTVPTAAKSECAEFWQWYQNPATNSYLSISTSVKNGGTASCRAFSASAVNAQLYSAFGTASADMFMEFDFRVDVYPGVKGGILTIYESTTANFHSPIGLRMDTNGRLTPWYQSNATDAASVVEFGLSSIPLVKNQWYRIGLYAKYNSTTSISGEFRLNGVSLGRFDNVAILNNTATLIGGWEIGLGWNITALPNNSGDWYYDNIIVNDSTGSYENTWPGDQIVIGLFPNGAGTVNTFETSAGGAGSSTNYQAVDEVTPDDATTYNRSKTQNQEDLYVCTYPGIGSGEQIKVVEVGYRFSSSGTGASVGVKLEAKVGSGGTVKQSTELAGSKTEWRTNTDIANNGATNPRLYPLQMYIEPDDATAWVIPDLNQLSIGFKATGASTTRYTQITSVWAMLSYVSPKGFLNNYQFFKTENGISLSEKIK